MKVLILAESLRINSTSSGIVSSTMINALVEEGVDVSCLYEKTITETVTWLPKVKLHTITYRKERNFSERSSILNIISSYTSGNNLVFRSKINPWVKKIESILKDDSFDLIIVLGSGSSFAPHYAMCNISTDIPWLANFHDPYPMSLYPKPYRKKRNLMYFLQERNTKKIINKASFVSFPSLYLQEMMQQYFPLLKNKSIVLPHTSNPLTNLPSAKLDDSVNLSVHKFNILHAGTLLGPRKVDSLFQAFQIFLDSDIEKKEKSILTILGKISKEHNDFFSKKYSNNLNIILDRVSYKKSLELIKSADVSLIIEAEGVDFSPFMPGKLADLISLEKPILVLSPKKSETNRILGPQYEYTSESNDVDKIVLILNKMWDLWKDDKLKLQDAERLKKYISGKQLTQKLEELLLI